MWEEFCNKAFNGKSWLQSVSSLFHFESIAKDGNGERTDDEAINDCETLSRKQAHKASVQVNKPRDIETRPLSSTINEDDRMPSANCKFSFSHCETSKTCDPALDKVDFIDANNTIIEKTKHTDGVGSTDNVGSTDGVGFTDNVGFTDDLGICDAVEITDRDVEQEEQPPQQQQQDSLIDNDTFVSQTDLDQDTINLSQHISGGAMDQCRPSCGHLESTLLQQVCQTSLQEGALKQTECLSSSMDNNLCPPSKDETKSQLQLLNRVAPSSPIFSEILYNVPANNATTLQKTAVVKRRRKNKNNNKPTESFANRFLKQEKSTDIEADRVYNLRNRSKIQKTKDCSCSSCRL